MSALARISHRSRIIALLAFVLAMFASLSPAPQLAQLLPAAPVASAQGGTALGPQSGDVFRQFQDNLSGNQNTTMCNSQPSNCNSGTPFATRATPGVVLRDTTRGEEAARAEAIFEYWGGHLATTQQQFNVNNGPWTPFPDIQNIPADTLATCYFRNPTNAVQPLALSGTGGVRPPGNTGNTVSVGYNYQIGPQDGLEQCASSTNFYWGNMWVYEVTTRIYYDPSLAQHPTGSITAPAGGSFGDNPTFSVSAQSSAGRTIQRVDLIGNYLDYDWDGDGVLREWQYALKRGVWERMIGTRATPSSGSPTNGTWNFAWDTTWIPDQDQPVQLMARITDNTGLSYMTPIVSASLNRPSRSVRMYNTYSDYYGTRVFGPPRNYGFNAFQSPSVGKVTNISIRDSLANATSARFLIYSWSANPANEDLDGDGVGDTGGARTDVQVNSRFIWEGALGQRFGKWHDYSFDSKDFSNPSSFLNQGDNRLRIWSNRKNHKLEVLWPGPAIFVQFSSPPTTPGLTASDTTLSTPEDQALALTLPVSNGAAASLRYAITTPPTLGTLSGTAPNFTYTPNANANGSDSLAFSVADQYGRSASATVSINVQSVPDAPQIVLGEGALLNPGGRFTRTATVIDPDSASLIATVDYGDGAGSFPLVVSGSGVMQLDYQYRNGGRFPLTVTVSDGETNGTASAIINVLTPGSPAPTGEWATAFTGWRYRFPLRADAGAYPRTNRVAEFDVNFSTALTQAGGSGPLLPESIRVVEVDGGGAVVDPNVTYQFDPVSSGYNATSNARGTLLVLMKNLTPAGSSRNFQVYFETNGRFTAPIFTPLVVVTSPSLADYRRDTAAVIETRDPDGARNATYYYSLNGGAFISLMDKVDANWIDYSIKADSAGAYRGVPNTGPVFHPGYYSTYPSGSGNELGSNQRSTTTIVRVGPLRSILRSVSNNGQWEATWELFPTQARMTMVRTPANAPYWWLYEGTPGGALDGSDRWVRADGGSNIAFDNSFTFQERFQSDINGPEWVYFRAGEAAQNGRALWVANHDDADTKMDMYRQLKDGSTTNPMTVFGFGRREIAEDGSQTLRAELNGAPKRFSMGFLENAATSFDGATGLTVEGNYRDVPVTVGQGQRLLTNLAPWADADTFRTRVGQTLNVAAPGVRANDSDGDGDSISLSLTDTTTSGTLTFNPSGSFSYVPNAGFSGTDSFTYTATDGKNAAPPTTVTLRVTNNNVPTAVGSNASTLNTTALNVPAPGVLTGATDTDGDALTAVLVDPPFSGTLVLSPNGAYSYTPEAGFSGVDSFSIAASDGQDQSEPATVRITVVQPNRAPSVVGSSAETLNTQVLNVPAPGVLTGASDADGDLLSAVLIQTTTNGALTLNADGSYSYTPQASFVGVDSFSFAASDGEAQSAPQTVQITVGGSPAQSQQLVYLPLLRR